MTDTPAPSPTPAPAPSPAPAPVAPAPAPSPAPAAAGRPDWLPESYWDQGAAAINTDEFGKHYAEVATFHKTETERLAALAARKPDDIKIEVKLPDTVKVPDGMQFKIDDKDPRVPVIREMAIRRGWDQETVNDLVALDAQQQIDAHTAEVARVAAEDAKLGAKAPERKAAVGNWLKGLKDKGVVTAEEHSALAIYATDAATVRGLEKLMAQANGSVPGQGGHEPTPPAPGTVEQRWYGGQKG